MDLIHPLNWDIIPWISVEDAPSSQLIAHMVSTTAFRQTGLSPVELALNWLTLPPAIVLHG